MNIRDGPVAPAGFPPRERAAAPGALSMPPFPSVTRFDFLDLLFRQVFDSDQFLTRGRGPNELVELCLKGCAVAVLGILDHEDHPESDDARDGVGDELPAVRESENGSAQEPRDRGDDDGKKNRRPARRARPAIRYSSKVVGGHRRLLFKALVFAGPCPARTDAPARRRSRRQEGSRWSRATS